MRVSFHPDYFVELPPGHPFPMAKFPDLHDILLADGVVRRGDVVRPREAALDLLRLVHTEDYLWKLATGNLTASEERRIGIPWSERLWRRSRLVVTGTLNAALMALRILGVSDPGIARRLDEHRAGLVDKARGQDASLADRVAGAE